MGKARRSMTLADWVDQNPQIENLILCAPDVNGIMRGKAVPAAQAAKLEEGSARMALSTATVDCPSSYKVGHHNIHRFLPRLYFTDKSRNQVQRE